MKTPQDSHRTHARIEPPSAPSAVTRKMFQNQVKNGGRTPSQTGMNGRQDLNLVPRLEKYARRTRVGRPRFEIKRANKDRQKPAHVVSSQLIV